MTLYFVHLPKTAGTSLIEAWKRARLKTQWASHYVLGPDYSSDLHKIKNVAPVIHVLHGHYPWIGEGYDYCTVLRDPVERVVSLYRYACRHSLPAPKRADTLTEFVRQTQWAQDGMVRQLSGLGLGCKRPVTEEDLSRALQNLSGFKYVSLLSEVQEFCNNVCSRFGARAVEVGRENASPGQDPPSPAELQEVENLNRFDRRLYEGAVSLLGG